MISKSNLNKAIFKIKEKGASLVAQWLRICPRSQQLEKAHVQQ